MPAVIEDENVAETIDWQQTDLYRFFALVFASPTRRCFDLLANSAAPSVFERLWQHLECVGEFPGFSWFPDYQAYESTYIALFDVGVPEPPVPLFESAHYKARPAQEIALENTYFYEVLGLKSDSAQAVPDYLITQLEFLAALRYTLENASDEAGAIGLARAEAEFLERHLLNWIPIALSKLSRIGPPSFPVMMALLLKFLQARRGDGEL
jgi:DMSO reductase family type II enzyme chaperone